MSSCTGCLLGMAVGDSLGLPMEGLTRQRQIRIFGEGVLRQRLVFGAGMIGDDTEHAAMTAQALIDSGGDPDLFARYLSRHLRYWLLGLPAGVGFATLRSILKIWLGWPPGKSGVLSAGNGPAMRAPVIGVWADNEEQLRDLVRISSRMTHTDPRAEKGALLIAAAAKYSKEQGPASDSRAALASLRTYCTDPDLISALDRIETNIDGGHSPEQFACEMGLDRGISGFVLHTVPVALYCWLRFPDDYRKAVEAVIRLGGDTDTTGAIVGGLMGAALGEEAIPREWLGGIREQPRSVKWMRRLGEELDHFSSGHGTVGRRVPLMWPLLPARNLLFTLIVLYHGFRRLLPPY